MGSFYTNYTLRGPEPRAVAAALAGRSAIVSPAQDGCVVVFDEESDGQDYEIIAELGSRLSGQFRCPLLAVLNHDDGFLWYQLYLSGELVDEYHSCPGYFDEDAVMAGPEGGNAEKLCRAFGADAVAKVERILREPSTVNDGYLFAMDRHADLAAALGIPSFAVAAGFELISIGEVPEELDKDELIQTKDLPPGPPLEDTWRRPVPGYYKVSFRANPQLTRSIPIGWMPGTWSELECRESDLSEAFRKAAAPYREKFKQLGFAEQGFKKMKGVLHTAHRDDGGINYLDASRSHYGQLLYNRVFLSQQQGEKEQVVISFTALFEKDALSCTNRVSPVDDGPMNHTVIRIESNDVLFLYEKFLEELKLRTDRPRRFDDLSGLREWFDGSQITRFENNVRRGLWVRMSDYERQKLKR